MVRKIVLVGVVAGLALLTRGVLAALGDAFAADAARASAVPPCRSLP